MAFRIVAANQMPDHVSIARFRRAHTEALSGLFLDVLRLCKEAGLAEVGVVAVDGTKVKANASLDANRTHANLAAVGVAQPVGVLLADGEWNLLGTSHNLLKLFRSGTKGPR